VHTASPIFAPFYTLASPCIAKCMACTYVRQTSGKDQTKNDEKDDRGAEITMFWKIERIQTMAELYRKSRRSGIYCWVQLDDMRKACIYYLQHVRTTRPRTDLTQPLWGKIQNDNLLGFFIIHIHRFLTMVPVWHHLLTKS